MCLLVLHISGTGTALGTLMSLAPVVPCFCLQQLICNGYLTRPVGQCVNWLGLGVINVQWLCRLIYKCITGLCLCQHFNIVQVLSG